MSWMFVDWFIGSLVARSCFAVDFDVVIYRATPGGIAAAISAAEMQSRVLLLEPTGHVGGMATEGGIGMRDGHDYIRSDPRLSQYRWGKLNANFYGIEDGVVWQPDNWVGERSFFMMLEEAGVHIELDANVVEGRKGLKMEKCSPNKISAIQLENSTWITASYFIDASYEGEIMRAAGVDHRWGRESASTFEEPWAGVTNYTAARFPLDVDPFDDFGNPLKYTKLNIPLTKLDIGSADDNVMAYSYRVCLTKDPLLMVPINAPPGYNSSDFELARRLVQSELRKYDNASNKISEPWLYLDYMGYKQIGKSKAMKYDACCGVSPFGIDAVGLGVGYANASRKERANIAARHRYYVHGLLWFWRSDPIVPECIRKKHAIFGFCRDEWPDNSHFPRQLYVREASRLVGDKVFTQRDRGHQCRRDSIGIGTWGLDIHEMQRVILKPNESCIVVNEGLRGDEQGGIYPFELPYWLILPKRNDLSNLAVINCPSASHVAFSAIRTEPTLWQLGMAAGTAASIAVSSSLDSLHDVNISLLSQALIHQGVVVHLPLNRTCGEAETL